MPNLRITKKDIRFIIEHYNDLSAIEIGKKIGRNHTTVLWWVKRLRAAGFSLKKRGRGKGVDKTKKIVLELSREYEIKSTEK